MTVMILLFASLLMAQATSGQPSTRARPLDQAREALTSQSAPRAFDNDAVDALGRRSPNRGVMASDGMAGRAAEAVTHLESPCTVTRCYLRSA